MYFFKQAAKMTAVNMSDITKRFPLVLANDRVNFKVKWGEIHALIGENGAGKSTLMKILYGHQAPDSGKICIDDKLVSFKNSREAIDIGIGMVYQHFMLVDTLTVTENIILGAEPTTGLGLSYRKASKRSAQLIADFGFDINPHSKVKDLPLGLQQQVEILKTLYRNARILIMDEPTAVLTPQETHKLFSFIDNFAAKGNAVIFISHKLDEVIELCGQISVMRDGKMIGTVNRKETSKRALANMMVGREVILHLDKKPAKTKGKKLELKGVKVLDPVKQKAVLNNVSFSLQAGEILGVAGIEGNGQSELVEGIVGLRSVSEGEIFILGESVTDLNTRRRREKGLGYIPEDRNERGLIGEYSAAMNSILGDHYHIPYSNNLGFLNEQIIQEHAESLIQAYDVRPQVAEIAAQNYSGGNAQKLIVARELERKPQVLIASQPTRGIDIGAIEFIHKQIVAARDKGLAVLLVSADLNEVLNLSDRIIVLYEGKIMGEFQQAEITTERLGLLMAGSNNY